MKYFSGYTPVFSFNALYKWQRMSSITTQVKDEMEAKRLTCFANAAEGSIQQEGNFPILPAPF